MPTNVSFNTTPVKIPDTRPQQENNPLQAIGDSFNKLVQQLMGQEQDAPEIDHRSSSVRVADMLEQFSHKSVDLEAPSVKSIYPGQKMVQYLRSHGRASGKLGAGQEKFAIAQGQILHEAPMWAGLAKGKVDKTSDGYSHEETAKVARELGRFSAELSAEGQGSHYPLPAAGGSGTLSTTEKSFTVIDESGLYGKVGIGNHSEKLVLEGQEPATTKTSHWFRQIGLKKPGYTLDAQIDHRRFRGGEEKTLKLGAGKNIGAGLNLGVDLEHATEFQQEQVSGKVDLQKLTLGHKSGVFGRALRAQTQDGINYMGEIGIKKQNLSASVRRNFQSHETQLMVAFDSNPESSEA